ncbi:hypothetical protein [Actinophytocola sp.]|uniref:hypothetical protein n=1 Tax=Actinophytocola sp. TaxID=1872138 RepID=UPI002ED049C5
MRDRVASAAARLVRVCVVLALVPVMLLTGIAAASASTADGVAASNMQFPIGPVGVAAVVVGLGGLVTGLVRHRRRETAASKSEPETVIIDKAAA